MAGTCSIWNRLATLKSSHQDVLIRYFLAPFPSLIESWLSSAFFSDSIFYFHRLNLPMRALLFSLTMVFTMCLASCNRNVDGPFLGKWTFDRDYTQSHLPKDLLVSLGAPPLNDPFPKGFPEDSKTMPDALSGMMNKTLKPALTKQLISQMEDQSFAITPKLITGVDGTAKTYEVIEHPNADT